MSTKYHEVTTWRELRELAEAHTVDERKPLRSLVEILTGDGASFARVDRGRMLAAVTPQGQLVLKITT